MTTIWEQRKVAERFLNNLRDVHQLGHHGGEEFVIHMPETGVEGAHSVAERLHQDIADEPFYACRAPVNITVSLGVAEMDDETSDLTAFINRADTALYNAKQRERNHVPR